MTLRIHSNTHDKNGQPVFSILRLRRNEIFGPGLDVYCANRGKIYGTEWMFVYRYEAGTQEDPHRHMQITLTWDMTPADVKDEDFPGMAMRNVDTIYVMQAKPPSLLSNKDGNGMPSPGPQVEYREIELLYGETILYQKPDVSRQWYEAVERDANSLRTACGSMKTTILRQQTQLEAKDRDLARQKRALRDLGDLARQLQRRAHLAPSDPLVQALNENQQTSNPRPFHLDSPVPSPLSPLTYPTPLLPLPPAQHHLQPFTTTTTIPSNPIFEADRAPLSSEQPQYSSFTSAFSVPEYTHQPNMDAALNRETMRHGRVYEAGEEVQAEGEGDEADAE